MGKETIIYVGKNDITDATVLSEFKKKGAETITDFEELKTKITTIFEKEFLGLR